MVLCNHAINGSHAMTPLYSKIGKAPRSTGDITRQLISSLSRACCPPSKWVEKGF